MTTRETQLEAAVRANAELRVQAERLIAAYVAQSSMRVVGALVRIRRLGGHKARDVHDGARRTCHSAAVLVNSLFGPEPSPVGLGAVFA
jgi:hypothetical protein